MGTTYRELRRECAPWSKRCLEKRIGNSGRIECSNRSCDASGHWALDLEKVWTPGGSTQTLGPLTTGRARGLLREIFSLGRDKLDELQGAVEPLEDLMRRYTQKGNARNGHCHSLAEDIGMAALEELFPVELERHCQLFGPEGSQVTILVCKCKRTGYLAATQVPKKGMNVYALAFFTGWLRGLGRKRLLLRSDNERALLAFLRAAAASLEGVEVIEQVSLEGDRAANGLAEGWSTRGHGTDSSAEESSRRETQETARLE